MLHTIVTQTLFCSYTCFVIRLHASYYVFQDLHISILIDINICIIHKFISQILDEYLLYTRTGVKPLRYRTE